MAHGIQVLNADGSLQFDTNGRTFRALAYIGTGTGDGSAFVDGLAQGTVAVMQIPAGLYGTTPYVSVAGSAVSWTYGSAPVNERQAVGLVVGVY
jgi:hypothetical protein